MTPVFSGEVLTAMIASAIGCFILPLVFLGYYRAKTGVKISSFFIGMGCYFLFSFLGGSIVNMLFLSGFGLSRLAPDHPVYLSLYYAFSAGICSSLGIFFGLKYAMKTRMGKQNAFVFGVGAGGLECMLYGGIVNISALVLAVMVNSFGIDEYLSKMQIDSAQIEAQKQLIAARAAIPVSSIYCDALLQFLSMCLRAALTILIYQAITHKEDTLFLAAAVLINVIGYVPVYLAQADILTNDTVTICLMTVYTFVICSFTYRLYHRGQGES